MTQRIALLTCFLAASFSACASHVELTRETPQVISLPGESSVTSSRPPELIVQLSHAGYISAMALSADGRFLMTAGWDKTVRLWDAGSGQEIRRFEGHEDVVNAVSLSRDGDYGLTGSKDGTTRLWKTSDGEEILRLTGHSGAVMAVAFSPDGAWVLTGGADRTVRLWSRKDGKQIWMSGGLASAVSSVAFSPDSRYVLIGSHLIVQVWDIAKGNETYRLQGHTNGVSSVAVSQRAGFIVTGSLDNTARLWSIETGKEIRRFEGHTDSITTVAFSSDGGRVVTASQDGTARLWDVASAREVRRFDLRDKDKKEGVTVSSASISPDGRIVYTASERVVSAWDADDGRLLLSFKGNSDLVSAVAFSPDHCSILTGSWDDTARLWDGPSGLQVRRFQGHAGDVRSVGFSPDGRFVVTGSRDGTARLWEKGSGKEIHRFVANSIGVRSVSFSPEGRYLLTGGDDGWVRLWEAEAPFSEIRRFGPHADPLVRSAVFSPDGRSVLAASKLTVSLWDIRSGNESRWEGHSDTVNSAVFSPDGRFAVSASWDKTVRIWDVSTGSEVRRLVGHLDGVYGAVFSPDGRRVLTGSQDRTARLWDATSGEEVRCFRGHTSRVVDVAFSPDGRFILTASEDQTVRLWDASSGQELARLISFNDGTWAVVDPEGRFDASNGGDVEGLHWVVGNEPIALNQFKERYYEPGLLAKILGFNKEKLRDVQAFKNVALYPAIELRQPTAENSTLRIKLTNRGGGIGRVVVSLNGKELTPDARGKTVIPDARAAELSMDLAGQPYLIPGEKNVIEVRAYNAEGYLSSRGVRIIYDTPGEPPLEKPTLWAIVVGISDYAGDRIDLHYAAKDAHDIAGALQLGGARLLGAGKVHLAELATGYSTSMPTKENIKRAFDGARAASPSDILVVYFSGHGVGVGDIYYYLTQEARSTDLSDAAIRSQTAVSSEEMVEWLKQSPALKQVMVLDTCAAGTAAMKLVEQRTISSDQIRAIERLKDRTGFHILMGSAADAVSYEATQYEQGLLTYALLQGMRGPALREEEYVDVSKLFQHAADAVPDLALHIGGIQRPRIAAPKGTSFDIGQLTAEDRRKIRVAQAKPVLLPPVLQNADELFDDLVLTSRVRKYLRETSYASLRGSPGGPGGLPAVYVEAEQLEGAVRPSGNYSVRGDAVTANMVLVREGKRLTQFQIQGVLDDLEGFASRISDRILQAVSEIKE